MNEETYKRLIEEGSLVISDTPRHPREIATDENIAFAIRENEVRSKRAERDPYTMTTDKLAKKLPGMAHGKPYVATHIRASLVATRTEYQFEMPYDLWREADEDLLRETQEEYAMADFASIAAATAAGYQLERWQEQADGQFYTRLSKPVRGVTGEEEIAWGSTASGATQALADTNAISALNADRSVRYGFAEAGASDSTGVTEVADAT